MYVYVHVDAYMSTCTREHAYGAQRSTSSVFLNYSLSYFLSQSLHGHGVHQFI